MNSEKFVIRKNKYLADGINFITKEDYRHYINDKGEHMFEFVNIIKVRKAYEIMLKLRRDFDR